MLIGAALRSGHLYEAPQLSSRPFCFGPLEADSLEGNRWTEDLRKFFPLYRSGASRCLPLFASAFMREISNDGAT